MLTDNDLKSYINGYYEDKKITYTKLDKHDRAIGVLLEENKQLKEKIDKAIDYINDIPALIWNEAHEFDYDFDKLLEILSGDKE